MPAKSAKQQRYFGYLKAHPGVAAKRGISAKVVDEFAHKPSGGYQGRKVLPKRKSK